MYLVMTNKYSHEGSAFETVEASFDNLFAAFAHADSLAKWRRWARVVEQGKNETLYTGKKALVN